MSDTPLFYALCSALLLAVCVGCLAYMLWACMPSDENDDMEDDAQ